jgi:group I intron endonuclease
MIIYLTTNLITGEQYIGKDKNNDPNYLGSGKNLKDAIIKYGKNNFKKKILEFCTDVKQMAKQEEYWLNKYNAESNPLFYNKTNKAFGNSGHTKESKQNIIKGLLNRTWDKEWGKKSGEMRLGKKRQSFVSGPKHGNFNKPKSKIHKENMSKSHKGIITNIKPVLQYDINGNFLKEYPSKKYVQEVLGITSVGQVLWGKNKTAGGFIWKYKQK